MFRKNKKHQQFSLFDRQFLLPPKLRRQMEASWAHTFFHEVFVRIPEEPFAIWYSEEDSWPNAAVNVLIGAKMLKTGFGWRDAELEENMQFDLLARGVTRSLIVACCSALMVNCRRVHQYRQQQRQPIRSRCGGGAHGLD